MVLIWKSLAELSADPSKEPPKWHRGWAAKLKGSEGKGEVAGNNLGHKAVEEAQNSGGRKGQDRRTDEYLKLKPQKHKKTGLILMGYRSFCANHPAKLIMGLCSDTHGAPGAARSHLCTNTCEMISLLGEPRKGLHHPVRAPRAVTGTALTLLGL